MMPEQEGLKHKYRVLKVDGSEPDPDAIYFVLKPNSRDPIHAKASRKALLAYASVARRSHLDKLARDLEALEARLHQEQFIDLADLDAAREQAGHEDADSRRIAEEGGGG